jgi:hypothetical protein
VQGNRQPQRITSFVLLPHLIPTQSSLITRFFISEHASTQKQPKPEAKKVAVCAAAAFFHNFQLAKLLCSLRLKLGAQGWFGGMLGGGGESEDETKNDMKTLQVLEKKLPPPVML